MLKTLSLILPVLIPSWRFFRAVEPSPRVQWAWVDADDATTEWQEFRERPLTVSPFQMLCRLFWNPAWNDTLFIVSCAERIATEPNTHSIHEIKQRLLSDPSQVPLGASGERMQFRLVFVSRGPGGLEQEVVYLSDPFLRIGPG